VINTHVSLVNALSQHVAFKIFLKKTKITNRKAKEPTACGKGTKEPLDNPTSNAPLNAMVPGNGG